MFNRETIYEYCTRIEKHFGTIKSQNDHTGLHPAAYASEIVNDIISTCKVLEPVNKPKKSRSKYLEYINLTVELLFLITDE